MIKFQQFPALRTLVVQCLNEFARNRPSVEIVLEGLRTVYQDLASHENNDIIELHDAVMNYKRQLAQKQEQLEDKEVELNLKNEQLRTMQLETTKQLNQLQTELSLVAYEKLAKMEEQLTLKDAELVESQRQIQELHFQLTTTGMEEKNQVFYYIS